MECTRLNQNGRAKRIRVYDPETVRARDNARYAANPEHFRQKQRTRNQRPDVRAAAQAYRATPEGKAKQIFFRAQWVSAKKAKSFDLTREFVKALIEKAVAAGVVTCQAECPDTASIDQIRPGEGYTQNNVQIVPQWYNQAKHDFAEADLHEAMRRWFVVNDC